MQKDGFREEIPAELKTHAGFMTWFENKFMKYEGHADAEDRRVFEDSVDKAIKAMRSERPTTWDEFKERVRARVLSASGIPITDDAISIVLAEYHKYAEHQLT